MGKELTNGFVALGIMGGSLVLTVLFGVSYVHDSLDVEKELWGHPDRYVIPISSWDIYEDISDVISPEERLKREYEKRRKEWERKRKEEKSHYVSPSPFVIKPEQVARGFARYTYSSDTPKLENDIQLKDFLSYMNENVRENVTFYCTPKLAVDLRKTIDKDMILLDKKLNMQMAWGCRYSFNGDKVTLSWKQRDTMVVLDAYRNPHKIELLTKITPEMSETEAKTAEITRKVYEMAGRILSDIIRSDMGDYEKVLAVHDYLVLNAAYTKDTEKFWKETDYQVSWTALKKRRRTPKGMMLADTLCDGYANAMVLLLRLSGVQCEYVSGQTRKSNGELSDGFHAWNMVCIDGQWAHVDVTWDDPTPDRDGKLRHSYFCLSDSMIARDHIWKREDYPVCNTANLFYYERVIKPFSSVEAYLQEAGVRAEKGQPVIVARVHGVTRYSLERAIARYNSSPENSYYVCLYCYPDLNGVCQVNMSLKKK